MAKQPDGLRITSANLNGIRSAASKGFFDWMGQHQADVVCVQELKAQPADLTPAMRAPHGYHGFFHCADKKGYSGVGIYSRMEPDRVIEGMGNPLFDAEGRYLRADFGNLSVVSVYVPSGSSSEERQALKYVFLEAFFPLLQSLLAEQREFVICGDWNIAHREIDLKNAPGWTSSTATAGSMSSGSFILTRAIRATRGGAIVARLMPRTWAGASTCTWPVPVWRSAPAAPRCTRRRSSATMHH